MHVYAYAPLLFNFMKIINLPCSSKTKMHEFITYPILFILFKLNFDYKFVFEPKYFISGCRKMLWNCDAQEPGHKLM